MAAHPLDPISKEELEESVNLIRKERNLHQHHRFVSISLYEPPNQSLWAKNSVEFPRLIEIIILNNTNGHCHEALVDLTSKKVTRYHHIENVQPAYTPDEYEITEKLVKSSSAIREGLAKRGISDLSKVMVDLWAGGRGFIGENDDPSLRLVKPILYLQDETAPLSHFYGRPIEGLTPVVDLNKKCILSVEDLEFIPVPKKEEEFKRNLNNFQELTNKNFLPLKPLDILQPEGPSFVVEGYNIRWQGWDFRLGFNSREGLTVHTARIWDRDEGKFRNVMYRASCAEMVVPYGDPKCPVYRRNAFDVGEEGLGFNANSLELGCDCLGVIRYLDAVVSNTNGEARTIKNAICIHEEDAGVLWKHTDWRSGQSNVARSRRLSVSFFLTIANYDYGFFYHFYQDGTIQFEVKLTGILLTTGVSPDITQNSALKHSLLIREGLSAAYHQHFFNFRIEMGVDGLSNSVYEHNTEADNEHSVQGNAFTVRKTLFRREFQAQRNMSLKHGRFWTVVNHNKKNSVGDHVAYRLCPGDNTLPFSHVHSALRKRANFIQHHLWVTPYDENEKYPAGTYPNKPNFMADSGLPTWTQANRSIADTSVVLWYTLGVLHIPRLEEWPIMPVVRSSFSLMPDGFFNSNPTTYLRTFEKEDKRNCNNPTTQTIKSKL